MMQKNMLVKVKSIIANLSNTTGDTVGIKSMKHHVCS